MLVELGLLATVATAATSVVTWAAARLSTAPPVATADLSPVEIAVAAKYTPRGELVALDAVGQLSEYWLGVLNQPAVAGWYLTAGTGRRLMVYATRNEVPGLFAGWNSFSYPVSFKKLTTGPMPE